MYQFMRELALDKYRWLAFSLVILTAAAAWTAVSAVPDRATTAGRIPSPRPGFLAPDFDLTTLAGDTVGLAEYRGSVVVVNFWASWCPPCRAEMPDLREVYEANRERGLEILAVNVAYQDNREAAGRFMEEFRLPFPIPLDTSGEVAKLYLIRALPTTFFIDRQGVIREVIIGGPMSTTTLQTTVENLLQEGS